jgi:hypothetical protein
MLTNQQIEQFIAEGCVRLEGAFPHEVAARCQDILWADTGSDPDDPATWTKPVVWLGAYSDEPFLRAANTPILRSAFDQLVGDGRWQPLMSLGTFPIRFPAADDTGDTGWHIDASFPGTESSPEDYLTWHVNIHSKGRALLLLFLFSDVGDDDAPTRIRVGSHMAVARMLEPAGEEGLQIGDIDYERTAGCPEVSATGAAGTVYLCHPFLVHAAQVNRGRGPRFMAQPPLYARRPFRVAALDNDAYVPVERAIRRALRLTCKVRDEPIRRVVSGIR